MKTITETNPVVLLQEAVNLMKEGYTAYTLNGMEGVLELTMQKSEEEPVTIPKHEQEKSFTIEGYDALLLLDKIKEYADNAYELDTEDFYWDTTGYKRVTMLNPVVEDASAYTLAELQEMDWDDLRVVGKFHNCFNRNREVMVRNIIKAQGV